MADIVDLKGI